MSRNDEWMPYRANHHHRLFATSKNQPCSSTSDATDSLKQRSSDETASGRVHKFAITGHAQTLTVVGSKQLWCCRVSTYFLIVSTHKADTFATNMWSCMRVVADFIDQPLRIPRRPRFLVTTKRLYSRKLTHQHRFRDMPLSQGCQMLTKFSVQHKGNFIPNCSFSSQTFSSV